MSIYHAKRNILYIKTETTAGTFVGATALFVAANATLPFSDLKFAPTVEIAARAPEGPSLQQIQGVHGVASGKISFKTRLYTGGALGTVPAVLDDLFKACFCSSTVVASTSVTYASDPNSQTRLSIGFGVLKEDGTAEIQHAIAGAAGTFKMTAEKVGAPVMIEWEFTGKIAFETAVVVALDDATPQTTITYADEVTNGVKFQALTSPSGLTARNVGGFEFDRGVDVELVTDTTDLAGYEYAKIAKDNPSVSMAPVWVPIATVNELSNLIAGSVESNAFTLGSTAGKKATFTFGKLERTGLSDDARGVAQTWGVKAEARRTNTGATSDAFSIALV